MRMMAARKRQQGVRLSSLLQGFGAAPAHDPVVAGISIDSRKVRPGDLFLACTGTHTSGVRFIAEAARAGAVAAVAEARNLDAAIRWTIPVVAIEGLSGVAGVIAGRFFGEPTRFMPVIGVTGTNGKSSVSHFVSAALARIGGRPAGLIGTLGHGVPGDLSPGNLTTPDPIELQRILAGMRDRGFRRVVMEVSSHALEQHRVAGVNFGIGVFTNLSRDHLDYHGDMESYGRAKEQLLFQPGLRAAVLNLDDPFGRALRDRHKDRIEVIGWRIAGDAAEANPGSGEIVGRITREGIGDLAIRIDCAWGRTELGARLTGRFNAGNLMAALGALLADRVPFERAVEALAESVPVPGRMETFTKPGAPIVIVDYAHTPDALAKALAALRGRRPGRLVCVFGCGGDRDAGKRPLMGGIAEAQADVVYVTSDNPRSEPPRKIIDSILAGTRQARPIVIEPDRAAAIARAIGDAGPDDIVLVAGKGHEDYQEIAGLRHPFSDREIVTRLLEAGR
jgi:UDP-N-acetylmuramoyl-L-alanyl-D-glutamate--2,6-diaminopimelate ligase